MGMSPQERGKLGAIKAKEAFKLIMINRISNYQNNPTKCKNCSTILEYKRRHEKFCNRSCAAKFNNKNNNRLATKISSPCLVCQAPAYKVYCSITCTSIHKKQKRLEEFKLGKVSSHSARIILIDLHGTKCMECGWNSINPTTGICPIDLEHIDGNSENNSPTNLKLLCPNCHSLTPTYKALNIGNGRHSRKRRYQDGKSY